MVALRFSSRSASVYCHLNFAIANVQCHYGSSDEERTGPARAMCDHNYDRSPPQSQTKHLPMPVLTPNAHPFVEVTPMTLGPGLIQAVNVIQLTERPTIDLSPEPSRECNINRRVRRSEHTLRAAADCVSRGLTFQTVSERFNIPISTIRFFMARKGILPRRRRGRHGQSIRPLGSPEPPYHMQHYRLPDMLALRTDAEEETT